MFYPFEPLDTDIATTSGITALLQFLVKTEFWKVLSHAETFHDYCKCLDAWLGGAQHMVIVLGLTLTLCYRNSREVSLCLNQ